MSGQAVAPVLRPGDRVAVVAPSGPVPQDRLDAGLAVLRSWGLEVVEGAHLRGRDPRLPHLAASDRERAADLRSLWRDPGITAVFAGRGGYGAARLLEHLDPEAIAVARPTPLIGFSDITALFVGPLGARGIHGPVVTSLGDRDDATRERLRTLLFDGWGSGATVFDGLEPLVAGSAEGRLMGGNLTVLASLAGTPAFARHLEQRAAQGPHVPHVLVLEDVGEAAYRLDRSLTQLRLAGCFEHVSAVVVGDLTGCGPADQVEATLRDRLRDLGVPVWRGAPVGHGPRNLAFPLHVRVRVEGGHVIVA